jgi:hypothetical protein
MTIRKAGSTVIHVLQLSTRASMHLARTMSVVTQCQSCHHGISIDMLPICRLSRNIQEGMTSGPDPQPEQYTSGSTEIIMGMKISSRL